MTVRFAAADPGGANVLAAFLAGAPALAARAAPVWTVAASASRFTDRGISVRCFAGADAPDLMAAWRAAPRPAALITATSMTAPIEPVLWRLAAGEGVPSLAWLDQWTNLGVRFVNGRPDMVAAIDGAQRDAVLDLGFAPDRVLVAGQPHLAALAAQPVPPPGAGGALRVLYVSETYSADYAAGRLPDLGFDEHGVFRIVYDAACAALARDPGSTLDLRVKLHPHETPAEWRQSLDALEPPRGLSIPLIDGSRSGIDAARDADLVVGMSSMLLLEAMVLERPVVSLEPGRDGSPGFEPARRGLCWHANQAGAARDLVLAALTDHGGRERAVERQRRFLDQLAVGGADRVEAWIANASSAARCLSGHPS